LDFNKGILILEIHGTNMKKKIIGELCLPNTEIAKTVFRRTP